MSVNGVNGFSRTYRPIGGASEEAQAKANADIEVQALEVLAQGGDISSFGLPGSAVNKLQQMLENSKFVTKTQNEDGTQTVSVKKDAAKSELATFEKAWIGMNSRAIKRIFDDILKMFGG